MKRLVAIVLVAAAMLAASASPAEAFHRRARVTYYYAPGYYAPAVVPVYPYALPVAPYIAPAPMMYYGYPPASVRYTYGIGF